jgi:hypothetical protein
MHGLLVILYLFALSSCAPSSRLADFTKLTGPYLGQKPPGMTDALFAPGYVSTGYFEHSSPTFSPDGKYLSCAQRAY